jgi:hypothetical protein
MARPWASALAPIAQATDKISVTLARQSRSSCRREPSHHGTSPFPYTICHGKGAPAAFGGLAPVAS